MTGKYPDGSVKITGGTAEMLMNRFLFGKWFRSGTMLACVLGIVTLLLLSGNVYALTLNLYPTANNGTATNPTQAYSQNDTGALVSSSNTDFQVSGFDNTSLGPISDVTVWVRYRTSAAPGNDTYQFDAAVNGSTFSTTIVGASTTNRTSYVTASASVGAITWAQVGTLAVRCLTNRSAGPDNYDVDWDVAYIVVTYTAASAPSLVSGPAASATEYSTYVDSPFTITTVFDDNGAAISSCEWTTGAGWTSATVSGSGATTNCETTVATCSNGNGLAIQMRATNSGGTTTSGTLNRTCDTQPPTDGTLTATPGDTQVSLSWTTASDTGSGLDTTNTYKLVKATGVTPPADCTGAAIYQGANTNYTDNSVSNGTTYSYRLCAYDNLGYESPGSTDSATPAGGPTPPSVVSGPTPSSTDTGTHVDSPFTITSVFDDTGSAISTCQYTLNNGGNWNSATVSGSGASTNCETTSATCTNGNTLNIRMRATNVAGTTETGTISRDCDTAAPTDGTLTATPGDGQVDLSWTAATDSGSGLASTNTYKLVKATGVTPPADCSGAAIYQDTGLSYSDTAVSNGTTYSYRVCAYDNLGFVSTGATDSATPAAGCTRSAPTVSLGPDKNVQPANSVEYTVTVINNDTAACSNSTFAIAISPAETNGTDFDIPSVLGSATTGSLAPAGSYNTTLTVTAFDIPPATEGNTLTTSIQVTDGTNHAAQPGSDSVITTIKIPSLMHNSDVTASTKWSGSGGWGIAGGKYGEFTCETCHTGAPTPNIKAIKQTITAPNPTPSDFPGSGQTVVFSDTRPSTADFGDDSTGHATSTKICEVCHTYDQTRANGVKWHAYDMSAGGADLTHNNNSDCTGCHKHNAGFKGTGDSCDACHGNPPTSGAHASHTTVSSNDYLLEDETDCEQCHTGVTGYTYEAGGNHQNSTVEVTAAGYSSGDGTCSSACHNSTVSDGFWTDSDWLNCDACHGNPPADTDNTGTPHAKHIAAGASCATCHVSTPTDNTHIDDTSGANEGAVYAGMAEALSNEANVVVSTWADAANTCSNTNCHDPSDTGLTADWDTGDSTGNCAFCHGYNTTMATGSHAAHVNNATTFGDVYTELYGRITVPPSNRCSAPPTTRQPEMSTAKPFGLNTSMNSSS